MDRRTALKGFIATVGGLVLPGTALLGTPKLFGWQRNQVSLDRFVRRRRQPFLSQQNQAIRGTGKGKKAFLHLAFEQITGEKYVPHAQNAPDCVSQAAALGVDFLSAVQIAIEQLPQRWIAKCATEPIYGGSRVEIGGIEPRKAGSTGHWAAEWLEEYGVLLRQPYLSKYDFTTYDPSKALEYGREGCPDDLEPIAKEHPVKKTAICRSYSELRDCIYNGNPVMVCSNVGFGNSSRTLHRDEEGFLNRPRHRRRQSIWNHGMLFAGYDDKYRRPGALCFNSWDDDWIDGPVRGPQPPSTFWVDAFVVDDMLRQGDSFAFSGFHGFPRVNVPPYILY